MARRVLVLAAAVAILAGCGTSAGPSPASAEAGVSTQLPLPVRASPLAPAVRPSPPPVPVRPSPTASPMPTPVGAPTSTAPASTAPASTAPATLGPDALAVVVTDNLAVRSAPGTGRDSTVEKPYLQRRAMLVVTRGPVRANGYAWYEVMPLDLRGGVSPWGWVAAASKGGRPWIKATTTAPACPPVPASIARLDRLAPGVAVACFGGVPITLEATTAICGIDMADAGYSPSMFDGAFRESEDGANPILLADPGRDPCEMTRQTQLYLDSAGPSPEAIPLGQAVRITGSFDHPDARGCIWSSWLVDDSMPDPAWCRTRFVVSAVE